MSKKVIAAAILTVSIIGISAGYFLLQILAQNNSNALTINVPGGQTITETIEGKIYYFTYIQKGTSGIEEPYFCVTTPDQPALIFGSYVATAGSHYGVTKYPNQVLNIVVSQVTADTVTLQITPS